MAICCAYNLGGSFILGKILLCIQVGLLLWETWNRFVWEAGVSSGGSWSGDSGRGVGGLVRGVSFPCGAVVEDLPGFTITTVFVLFRNPRKPHFTPKMPDTPNTPQTPEAWTQFALRKCQRFCLNSSRLQKGVEVVPLDQEKTPESGPWELQSAEISACHTCLNVTRREVTPIWQLVFWSRNQSCLCDFIFSNNFRLISANFSSDKVLLLPWASPRTASLIMFILFKFSYQY